MKETILHPFEPIYDEASRVLILGTIPSPKSRELMFYYGHPQNRFWRILPDLFAEPPLQTIDAKVRFLHEHHIALWDVLASCEIEGAEDSSIRHEVPNDLTRIFSASPIRAVFTNGQKASACFRKYFGKAVSVPQISLPSTSPANCRNQTFETLRDAYKVILDYL